MKKLLLLLCCVGTMQCMQAQVEFGIKAGVNYNSDSFKLNDVQSDVLESSAESKTGYHAGIWSRINLGVAGLNVRPELVYTALKSEVTLKSVVGSVNTKADYNFQKIDVPVLLEKEFLGVAHAYIGPSFQYIIDGELDWEQVNDVDIDSFTVGLQLGAGVEFGALGLDLRWERGFNDTESELITSNIQGGNVKFDTRVNQIIVGLTYKF